MLCLAQNAILSERHNKKQKMEMVRRKRKKNAVAKRVIRHSQYSAPLAPQQSRGLQVMLGGGWWVMGERRPPPWSTARLSHSVPKLSKLPSNRALAPARLRA
jgi:hypothetical protein